MFLRMKMGDTKLRWINGNLQIEHVIIPWSQCTVNLHATYELQGEFIEDCVLFQFSHPNLVPGDFPESDDPRDWCIFFQGQMAEDVRNYLQKAA